MFQDLFYDLKLLPRFINLRAVVLTDVLL